MVDIITIITWINQNPSIITLVSIFVAVIGIFYKIHVDRVKIENRLTRLEERVKRREAVFNLIESVAFKKIKDDLEPKKEGNK